MITALIVDDERSGRENLQFLLEEYCTDINVVATVSSVTEAAEQANKLTPDAIFLDIDMPNMDGFALLDQLNHQPYIIFVTAHAEYAIQAIKKGVFDYILKPVDVDELIKCVEKLNQTIRKDANGDTVTQDRKLKINDSRGVHLLNTNDIIYMEADNNYTLIHLDGNVYDGKFVASRTMGDFEPLLPEEQFFRVHKSYIINVEKMSSYSKSDGAFVVMDNGDTIEIARRKVSKFRQFLNKRFDRQV